jgi:hypothetical protein
MKNLSQFIVEPRQGNWVATKYVLIYLRGIVEHGLRYIGNGKVNLYVYTDSNWVGSETYKKITLGCCFRLGSTMVFWFNRKQTLMVLSSTKSRAHFIQDNIQTRAV